MAEIICTAHAPAPAGPYSQALIADNLIFCSGQLGIDPSNGKLVRGSLAEEASQCLTNLSAVLIAAGSSLSAVVKTTVFVTDLAQFKGINETYARFFKEGPPARSTVQVSALPLGARVEIEAVAVKT